MLSNTMPLTGSHVNVQDSQFKGSFILHLSSLKFGMASCNHSLMFPQNRKIVGKTKHKVSVFAFLH